MRYQSPVEVPRGRFAHLAARASSPYWAALVGGPLPGFIWAAANARFLGCRDARRQMIIAAVGYAIILAAGAARYMLANDGALDRLFGEYALLVYHVWGSLLFIASLGVLRYLIGRQIDIAAYRATLASKLPWGLWLIAALALVNHYVLPIVYDRITPHIMWIWPAAAI